MLVDVVVPQLTEKGGLDKVINYLLKSLESKDMHFRLIELVSWGLEWWDESFEYYSLYRIDEEHGGINFYESAILYSDYLRNHVKPDMIFATGWPVTVNIVRTAVNQSGVNSWVIGWPHMSLDQKISGVGDVKCMEDADCVIAISDMIAYQVKKAFPNKKCVTIYNPIDLSAYCISSIEHSLKPLRIVYVGRLIPAKGLKTIFEAMKKASSDIRLTIIGNGMESETVCMAQEIGLENKVSVLGWQEAPWELAKNSSFFVTASEAEGFGLTTIEALASGIPVISTPVGCSPNVIKPGINGYLFPIGGSDMLAQILDCISRGTLPIPAADICRNSVSLYESENIVSQYRAFLEGLKE